MNYKKLGLKGIGKYPEQGFVNLDNREQECYWVKYKNKNYNYTSFENILSS